MVLLKVTVLEQNTFQKCLLFFQFEKTADIS